MEEARGDAGLTVAEPGRETNSDVIRRWVDAFNRRDIDSLIAQLDPDVELHEWPTAPGSQSYRGPDQIQAAVDSWFEVWDWMQIEIEDIVEAGDRMLVTLHQRAKGRGSEVEVEITSFNFYVFRDGKVKAMHLFTEPEPARKLFDRAA